MDRDRSTNRLTAQRAQIIKAASDVFQDVGFERASVDQIAAIAHMSKQSIYALFANKLAIFEATVRDTLKLDGSHLSSVAISPDLSETLRAFGTSYFDGFADPRNFGLFRASIVAANHCPGLAQELHEYRRSRSRKLADHLRDCMGAGMLEPADPLSVAIRFGSLAVEGSRYFLGAALPSRKQRGALVDAAIALFLHGYADLSGEGLDPEGAHFDDMLATSHPPAIQSDVAVRLSSEKIERLIGAVLAEFLEHGYPAAKMERAAKAAQSSTATIYRHFGSKEHLLRHAIEHEIHAISRVSFPVAREVSAREAVTAFARQVLDRHLTPSNIRMHRLLIQESGLVPDLAMRFHDMHVAVLAKPLRSLLDAYRLPVPEPAAIRAFHVLATSAVHFLTVENLPDPEQRDACSVECAHLFLHGLARSRTTHGDERTAWPPRG